MKGRSPPRTFDVEVERDPYPSLEVWQYQGDQAAGLAQEGQKPVLWALPPSKDYVNTYQNFNPFYPDSG